MNESSSQNQIEAENDHDVDIDERGDLKKEDNDEDGDVGMHGPVEVSSNPIHDYDAYSSNNVSMPSTQAAGMKGHGDQREYGDESTTASTMDIETLFDEPQ